MLSHEVYSHPKLAMTWDIQLHYIAMEPLNYDDDLTLPDFIKKMHLRKGKTKKQRTMTKVEAGKIAPKRQTAWR